MWKWLHRVIVGCSLLTAVLALGAAIYPSKSITMYPVSYLLLNQFETGIGFRVHIHNGALHFASETFLVDDVVTHANIEARFMGVEYVSFEEYTSGWLHGNHHRYHSISFDFWLISILASIYPTSFLIRTYRRRRVRRDALKPCDKCGYDLQGNESGVCPECGEATEVIA